MSFGQSKNTIKVLIVFFLLAILQGCSSPKYKPVFYQNTKWTCDTKNIYFVRYSEHGELYGIYDDGEKEEKLAFFCFAGSKGGIYTYESVAEELWSEKFDQGCLWSGTIEYYEDKFILTSSERNSLFEGECLPLTFKRENITEDEVKSLMSWVKT